MDDPAADGNQVVISLTAPDGQTDTVFNGTLDTAARLVGTITNTVAFLDSQVNGGYVLTVVDNAVNNTNGKLVDWSMKIDSFASSEVLQSGDAMDQNADGTSDENALLVGFTGTLTSGSALVTGISTTTGLFAGENVTGTGIPNGTTIKTVNSSTSVTLTAQATVNGVFSLATSYTGLNPFTASSFDTPGDVYSVPAPNLPALGSGTEVAYSGANSILNQPTLGFNSNTLPLIVSGPQVLTTQAVGNSDFLGTLTPGSALVTGILSTSGLFAGEAVTGTGIASGTTIAAVDNLTTITLSSNATVATSGAQSLTAVGPSTGTANLLTDDSTSQINVTFDRPVQVSSFTPSQVLSIMGPSGSVLAPQTFGSTSIDQMINAATVAGPGTLDSTLTIDSNNTLEMADITVTLSIASPADGGLTAVLVAPNGEIVPLFSAVGGTSGLGFVNTVFDDSAPTSITAGKAPFTGSFSPEYPATLSSGETTLTGLAKAGLIADGTWQLEITNTTTGSSATLDSWSLNITPRVTITPVNAANGLATEFTIGFPQQETSGTYTVQLGPDILDQYGDGQDPTSSAGLNVLRDEGQNSPTTAEQYSALNLPVAIPATTTTTGQTLVGTVSSTISVPDSFIISGDQTAAGLSVMQLQLNITFPSDPDLTATLSHYDPSGDLLGTVTLFSGVGNGPNAANFTNTVFDDNATTPIQQGTAPFSAIYNPQESLATVFAPTTGMNVQGTWTLTITNSGTGAATGTLNGWALTFQKPLPSSGVGEVGSDNTTFSFQIFTLNPSDPVSSEVWTAVGPASSTDEAGQVNAIAVDPSDPSGNTVYVGGASGGIWKTTDFLTTNPAGPTWVPLTNFGPNSAVNIASITVFPVNDNTNDSIIIAATGGDVSGEDRTDSPGVGFLISMDGGVTWNLDDSTDNVSSINDSPSEIGDTSNILPIDSANRNREFVGTTAYQVAVDPELTPNGQVIIYAALSAPFGSSVGGIWESQNTGQTWTQVLTGNATAVVLDPNSGLPLSSSSGGNPTDAGNYQIIYAGMTGGPQGPGVYMSTDQGQGWSMMDGNFGNPQIVDDTDGQNANPPLPETTPNLGFGKIVLAVPAATNNEAESETYSGWLYAAVATSVDTFDGLFVTKDFGENWTQIQLNSLPPLADGYNQAVPIDNLADPQYNIDATGADANIYLSVAIDPQNPNITYLGGFGGVNVDSDSGLIRVDATKLYDPHALVNVLYDSSGNLTLQSTGWTTINSVIDGEPSWDSPEGPLAC